MPDCCVIRRERTGEKCVRVFSVENLKIPFSFRVELNIHTSHVESILTFLVTRHARLLYTKQAQYVSF